MRIPEQQRVILEPWELPERYRKLKASILRLEQAWESDDLRQALKDPQLEEAVGGGIQRAYRKLLKTGDPYKNNFRRDSIHAILQPLKELLEEPRIWYDANGWEAPKLEESEGSKRDERDTSSESRPIHAAKVRGESEEAVLSVRQLIDLRFWNVGVEFADPAEGRWFVSELYAEAQRRLAVDLVGLIEIEAWLRRRPKLTGQIVIIPDIHGRRFEQLMIDILNEDEFTAERAPLVEDFLEKTDLRVHIPGVRRRNGARVQVTATTHVLRLEQKLSRIHHLEELVILSPRFLAEIMAGGQGEDLLHRGEAAAFWECLPYPPARVEELAAMIREFLVTAEKRALEHPWGPAAFVPSSVRRLIQTFVASDARRATKVLRARERREGPRSLRRRYTKQKKEKP